MERSFRKEVESLRLGAGETFHGEGILAITKALLQSGISYVGGYQGAPVSHVMDVLADAGDLLDEQGIHFEVCASEAAAAAMCAASINYPMRGAVVWKSTVGTNVASDALSNLASAGVRGGVLIVLGEDYGEGASIVQERTHAFAMKSTLWLMDPRPHQPRMVELIERGFELSEASGVPVMVEYRIRTCHLHGRFVAKDNVRPGISRHQRLEAPDFDYARICLPPATYAQEQSKINERFPAAVSFIASHRLNEVFPGRVTEEVGIITQGGLYNSVVRAFQEMGLADAFGACALPVYVLNVTYPLVPAEVEGFCRGKRAVLMVEEGNPSYLEQALHVCLRRAGIDTAVHGKDVLPMAGEYTAGVMLEGVGAFLRKTAPAGVDLDAAEAPAAAARALRERAAALLGGPVPKRPPGFCVGCPERPVFSAIRLLEKELGPVHVAADVGCHTFSTLPPFNIGNSVLGYGLGLASAAAVAPAFDKRVLSIMGDGGLWHNGLSSGVSGAVFNRSDSVLVIMDNGYSSATGQQAIPSTGRNHRGEASPMDIRGALRGLGVRWIRQVTTYEVARMVRTLREAMTTRLGGLKVIIASSECMLARQRRERPRTAARLGAGERVVQTRFGVDEELCTGDHSCIRLSGCPSLSVRPAAPGALRRDPIAAVDEGCVGCGLCGEVADAAALCPSFYRSERVRNPSGLEQLVHRVRSALTGG